MDTQKFGQKIMRKSIEVGLLEFGNRYLYTKLCKEKIHRMYPQPMKKLKFFPSKKDRIGNATPYQNNQEVVSQLV
jgi:hypothetical protein